MTRIIRTETRRRGAFGKIMKFLFIAFNVIMIIWLVSYWVQVGQLVNDTSGASQTGAAIGATIGTSFILMFWAAGDVILGLFLLLTPGKKLIVEETVQ
jgi:hypothetical protein